jgi:bacteriocin biosynthesis cyclodehydratase domain-containing protein
MSRLPARPCLALPFTFLTGPDQVRLIAGEDFRYTLTAPGLELWLPAFLPGLDGRRSLDELLCCLPGEYREAAKHLLARLYGERLLIDGPAPAAHRAATYRLKVEGDGIFSAEVQLVGGQAADDLAVAEVLVQDGLDYHAALGFNDRALKGRRPWLWLSVGPMNRGYVSPVFLPDAGPCLACLLTQFQRLSPAPELYDDLENHAREGKAIRPVPFPSHGRAVLRHLLLWKVELLGEPEPSAALFQLHVLEVGTLEVSAHRVFADPECQACSRRR